MKKGDNSKYFSKLYSKPVLIYWRQFRVIVLIPNPGMMNSAMTAVTIFQCAEGEQFYQEMKITWVPCTTTQNWIVVYVERKDQVPKWFMIFCIIQYPKSHQLDNRYLTDHQNSIQVMQLQNILLAYHLPPQLSDQQVRYSLASYLHVIVILFHVNIFAFCLIHV